MPARSRQVQHIIPEKKGIIKYTYGGTKTSPRLYTYDIPHSQHHYQKSTKYAQSDTAIPLKAEKSIYSETGHSAHTI